MPTGQAPDKHRTKNPTLFGLHLLRDLLDLIEYSKQVAAPEFFDLFFGVAAADKFECYVKRFGGVVPAFDASAAVEIGADADVIYPYLFHHIVDVIYKI